MMLHTDPSVNVCVCLHPERARQTLFWKGRILMVSPDSGNFTKTSKYYGKFHQKVWMGNASVGGHGFSFVSAPQGKEAVASKQQCRITEN